MLGKILNAPRWLTPLLLLYTFSFYPVAVTIAHGQMNLFVLLLLCLTWYLIKRKSAPGLTALPLALAILLKSYPVLLLLLLLTKRMYQVVLYVAAGLTVAAAVSYFALPREAWFDWLHVTLPSAGYGQAISGIIPPSEPWNQGINGFTARLFLDPQVALVRSVLAAKVVPYVLSVLVAAISILLARGSWKTHGEKFFDLELGLFLLTTYLVAPLSWEHHLVLILPAVLLALITVVEESWASIVAVALAAFALAWPIPFHSLIIRNPTLQLLISVKFYAVLMLWGYYVWALRRQSSREPTHNEPAGAFKCSRDQYSS